MWQYTESEQMKEGTAVNPSVLWTPTLPPGELGTMRDMGCSDVQSEWERWCQFVSYMLVKQFLSWSFWI